MKFMQISTGAVLEANNKEVIEMMKASDAYVAVEQSKQKTGKGDKSAKGDKPTE